MTRLMRTCLLLVLMTALALLAGCGQKQQEQSPSQEKPAQQQQGEKPKEIKKITIGQSVESLVNAPMYVAKAMGYFKEEGFDVEFTTLGAGPAFQVLLTGEVPIVEIASNFIPSAIKVNSNEPLAVANLTGRMTMDFVIGKKVVDKLGLSRNMPLVDRYKALKGMTIGISYAGAATEYYTKYFAKKGGLNPDKDLTLIAIGGAGSQLTALSSGQIDGFQWTAPTPQQAVVEGLGDIIISSAEGDVPELKDTPYALIVVNRDWAKKNPETVKAINRAIGRGANLVRNDVAKAKEVLHRDFFNKMDQKVFDMSMEAMKGAFPQDAAFTEDGMKQLAKAMVETGEAKQEFDTKEGVWWTNDYITRTK